MLAGVSAGSLCWHVGGTTDTFGPDLRPVTDGLGLLPYSNGVHYDSEQQRRPLYQQLVADGTLRRRGHATGRRRRAWSTAAPSWSRRSPTGPATAAAYRRRSRDAGRLGVRDRRIEPRRLDDDRPTERGTGRSGRELELSVIRPASSPTSRPGRGSASCTRPGSPATGRTPCCCWSTRRSTRRASAPLPHERPFDGTPVIDVDRGGKITWHGPGQLVGYPIVALPDPVDVVAYVRRLEEALIDVCAGFGVATGRVEGRSGVWVAGRPARPRAQGRRDRRPGRPRRDDARLRPELRPRHDGVRQHDPCGIADAGVTSLSAELGRDVPVAEVIDPVEVAMTRVLAFEPADRG